MKRFIVAGFEWDEGNLDEIYYHHVREEEVEECFANPLWYKRKPGRKPAQERFYLIGRTSGGRKLFIVYEMKPGKIVRPITAYDK
jgi:uncharacterized protein